MDLRAAAKCIIKQDTGLAVDEASNKLAGKSVMLYKMTYFIITEEETSTTLWVERLKLSIRWTTSVLNPLKGR